VVADLEVIMAACQLERLLHMVAVLQDTVAMEAGMEEEEVLVQMAVALVVRKARSEAVVVVQLEQLE
jgi:hypothetical protein